MLAFEGDRGLFALAGGHAPAPVHTGSGAEPLTIVYTSGTTGQPKGVVNCHTGYIESGRLMAEALDITARDRIMVVLPLFHANPQVYAVMSAVHTGCTLLIRPKFSVSRFFDDARAFRATMFTYVGTILAMLVSRLPEGDRNHTMTRCVGGGCTLDAWRKLKADFGVDPYELYGMSETAGWVSANSVTAYRQGTCGKVRDDIELAVVDEGDKPVPVGTPGEIVIRPRQPFRILLGYWDDPAATQEASRNFWFHTGDVGQLDADGFLSFLGRRKEIIRKGGENISPAELEAVILDFDPVEDAAVVAVPDPILGDEIKACIVARRPFGAEELIRFLEPRVARFMLPRYLQFLDRIPRTETEKIQRNLLQQDTQNVLDISGSA
jgi:crotonobetaine/carnitine-CoA ligase